VDTDADRACWPAVSIRAG